MGNVNQPAVALAPRRAVGELDFADAGDDGSPEVSEDCEGFAGHDRFVEHFPDDGELDKRTSPAFAGDEAMAEADQLKQTVLPGGNADFDVHPGISFAREKLCSNSVGLAATFFCSARHGGHHAAIGAAANGKTPCGQQTPQQTSFFIIRLAFLRTRAAEHGDDFFTHRLWNPLWLMAPLAGARSQ